MKITSVKAYPVGVKLPEPLWWGELSVSYKGGIVVEIETDEGITGYGEAGFSVEFFPLVGVIVNQQLGPMLIGLDPSNIAAIWRKMFDASHIWGRRGVQTYALSGIDIALWDLMGKVAGLPTYKLLGAAKSDVRAYFAPSLKPADQIVGEAAEAAARGFEVIKLRVGKDEAAGIDLVRQVRKELGDGFEIAVDPNMSFDRYAAQRVARVFEDLGVIWIEEPIRTRGLTEYFREHSWLADQTTVKISGGESLFTRFEYLEPLERHVFDLIQPDAVAVGGISECKRVADMASAWKIDCVPHVAMSSGIGVGMSANLHVILACENTPLLEFDPYGGPAWDGLLTQPLEVVDGHVAAVDLPGLGIEFAQLDKFRLDNVFA